MNTTSMMQSKTILSVLLVAALILLAPLVAMQFTDEVDWGVGDFVIAGALLLGAALTYQLATRMVRNVEHRVAMGVTVIAVLLLLWAELAVGVFGTPAAGS